MIGNSEKCLDPWHGFFIILAVCLIILGGIFNEFKGGSHHARIHAHDKIKAKVKMQEALTNSKIALQPVAGQITF